MPAFSRRQSGPPTSTLNAIVNQRLLDCRREFLGFFRRRLNRPEDAEDALQDFCLKVVRAAETLGDDEKIDSWLGRILRNTLTDHYRRRAARQRAEAAYGLEMQTAVFEVQAEQDAKPCSCVHHALPTLRPHYAEILTRADLNEEPREQIAADLGLTTNNVGVRLHRARQALKAKLEDICPTCRDRVGLGCNCEPAGETRSRLDRDPAKRNATAPGASLSR
ncbi:RNA polymerase sigma factor [Rhodoligotrophos defluvii]|uniref:RNA polymerase sigma factor n=1 Tax=Rhodoligotrophos defluvii TaxID=2561934 RepID=UPI0010C9BD52|nr:RNA polymerase sigma factor [Rhodoligotrophos defluvii]